MSIFNQIPYNANKFRELFMNQIQKTIFSIHLKKSTGKLSLRKDETKKEIYFKKGYPIYVESSVRGEALGQILLHEGKITDEQLKTVLDRMAASGRKQGECLVELGYLSAYEVYQTLEKQMDRKFQNCLLFDDATTDFFEGETFLQDIPEFKVDIFHAIVDYFTFNVDEEKLSMLPQDKGFKLTVAGTEYFAQTKLFPQESKVLRLLDGKKTMQQIQETVDGDYDFTRMFIFVLFGLKFTEITDIAPKVTKPMPEMERNVVVIKEDVHDDKKNQTSPIYAWALKLGKPLQDILDIKPNTPKSQIQRNYDHIIKELHLDRIESTYVGKEKDIALSVFDRLSMALTIFTNETLLKLYMANQAKKETQLVVPPKIQAEIHIQKSKVFLNGKDFSSAEIEIQKAIELDAKEISYLIIHADMLMRKAAHEKTDYPKTVVETLKKAISINANDPEVYFQLGTFFKLNKELEKSIDAYAKCVEISPNHARANSELRLLNKRALEQKKSSPSLFSGLFAKKDDKDRKK